MSVTKITKDNFQELVLNADREVLLDFWRPGAAPAGWSAPL